MGIFRDGPQVEEVGHWGVLRRVYFCLWPLPLLEIRGVALFCYVLPAMMFLPHCIPVSNGAGQPWTEASENVSHSKSSLRFLS